MTASIVIRTKNEEAFLGRTLEAIHAQDYRHYEIIVVDSGSTDGTLAIARQFNDITIIEINPEQFSYGGALNIGTAESSRDIIVFLSAHAIPVNNRWLSNIVKHFQDPKVAAVYGRQLPHDDAYPPVKATYLNCYKSDQRLQTTPNDHFFSNANAAIIKRLWDALPFDEDMPGCEDQMWAKQILSLGYKIMYEPEAAVYHSHNESLMRVYQRSCREERGFMKIDSERRQSLITFWQIWWRKSVRDVNFIVGNNEDKKWLPVVPVYRLFDVYGTLHPHLPGALWTPLQRRLRFLRKWFNSGGQ